MKTFFATLRGLIVAGFLFLLPLYIVVTVVTRAWTALSGVGAKLATLFGLNAVLGVGASTLLSLLLLVVSWLVCGLLVRISLVDRFGHAVEQQLSKYIPGYAAYKATAEAKVHIKTPVALPYSCVLIRWRDYWRPAFVIEQDGDANAVVFLPDTPDTTRGTVLLASSDQLRFVTTLTANQLDASLKNKGKGLLSEHGLHPKF